MLSRKNECSDSFSNNVTRILNNETFVTLYIVRRTVMTQTNEITEHKIMKLIDL